MTELTPSEITGRRVKALRGARGWSVRRLVDECRAIGFEVTSNVIENIEGIHRKRADDNQRRRGITVDELMALALVLEVSPLALLLPETAGPYAITPDVQPLAEAIYKWIIAELERPDVASGLPPTEERLLARAALRKALPWTAPPAEPDDADAELAQLLGVRPDDVIEAAERLWGRTLHQERNRLSTQIELDLFKRKVINPPEKEEPE